MKTNLTQRKFYILYVLLVLSIFLSRKTFAQCGAKGGNGATLATTSMTIDGNMSDWTPFLNDPDNNSYDGTPDFDSATITDKGRDMQRFVVTYSGSGLYMYFSRVAANNNSIDFLVYLDVNNNSLMEKNEPVVDMSWNGSNGKCMVKIYDYTPAVATGDSLTKKGTTDGYSMPGSLGATARTTIGYNGKGSADGLSLEVYVPWSYLTQTNSGGSAIYSLGYNMPFKYHASSLNGTPASVPGANSIDDNFGGCFGGTIQKVTSLPIILSYFNAYAADNNAKVTLNWVTEMELNNEYYTIERSQDGKNFTAIGMVLGSMNSSIRKTYEYKDNLNGVDVTKTIYYRVKQSDIDGKSTYSPIRSVRLSQKQNMIQVNPNPFVDNITVKYMSEVSGTMNIKVVNMNGQTVVNKTTSVNKGFNSTNIANLGSLPKGLYVVEVMINGEVSEKTKLMKN